MIMALAILAALVFGFLMGRVWQIRCDELERRAGFALPPVAHIAQPKGATMPLPHAGKKMLAPQGRVRPCRETL